MIIKFIGWGLYYIVFIYDCNYQMPYDFDFKKIDELSDILDMRRYHYQFKNINFLFDHQTKDNLIVFFHGSVPQFSNIENINRVVFRGYNYTFSNADILSFSDGLMNTYSEYMIGWFLSTKNNDFDKIYKEIMSYIFERFNYKNILFTGTSGGGYPSIKYACHYKQNALISNSQLYLDKFNRRNIGYNKLRDILRKYDDDIVYDNDNDNIENIVMKSIPKKIIIYSNMLDYTYYVDLIKFCRFMTKKNLDDLGIIDLVLFEDCESDELMVHQIQFPNKEKYMSVLERTINGI